MDISDKWNTYTKRLRSRGRTFIAVLDERMMSGELAQIILPRGASSLS